jgi:hypothetical protein
MMRLTACLIIAAALQVPAAVVAQQITIAGWVDRVDTQNSTVTIRTLSNPRTIQVAPDAVIRVDGQVRRLDQLPINSRISIIAQQGPNDVLRATQLTSESATGQPAAGYPPGSQVTGRLVEMDIPSNQITLRTQSGDFTVPLGTAPLLRNGTPITVRDLQIGQWIQVERTLPTEGSTEYVTQTVRVLLRAPTIQDTAPDAARQGSSQGSSAVRFYTHAYPQVTVRVDDAELVTPGILRNGRTLLPVRELVERLDGTVRWHPANKTVWAAFPAQARTIRITVGSPVAQVFEYAPSDPHRTGRLIQTQRLDQPPILVNGHVFAPVAAAARVAGATVWFEPGTRQVMVQTGPPDQTASG